MGGRRRAQTVWHQVTSVRCGNSKRSRPGCLRVRLDEVADLGEQGLAPVVGQGGHEARRRGAGHHAVDVDGLGVVEGGVPELGEPPTRAITASRSSMDSALSRTVAWYGV